MPASDLGGLPVPLAPIRTERFGCPGLSESPAPNPRHTMNPLGSCLGRTFLTRKVRK